MPHGHVQKYREKRHPTTRMDYSSLDVELDLTIQFEMQDDEEDLKISFRREVLQSAFAQETKPFEATHAEKSRSEPRAKGWVRALGVHPIIRR
jgi:hypothetical protein